METSSQSSGNNYSLSRNLSPELVPLQDFKPLGRQTHKHSPKQIRKLADSLDRFGFVLPILVDADGRVVAGWGLILAARKLGLPKVPAVRITDLSEADLRLLRLSLNRLAEDSSWDREMLSLEFSEILELNPQIELKASGFEIGEIDSVLYDNGVAEEDELPTIANDAQPVTKLGDLWILGEHRLLCGDSLCPESYPRLLGSDKAEVMFADPPYNVPIGGHVSGLGSVKHEEFAMASGELSSAEFTLFLEASLHLAAANSVDSAIHFVCMDWRHQHEILTAGGKVYSSLENLCVWNKSNAGMGSLYRSKHELIFVFKIGDGAHINNVLLGRYGRHRTNVWDYISQNALNGTKKSKLSLHPTVKPVALIADAIRDCSNLGGLVLDPFSGVGTTLIAVERTGRRARAIEISPAFVDLSIERWQHVTGGRAVHAESGRPFTRTGADIAGNTNGVTNAKR